MSAQSPHLDPGSIARWRARSLTAAEILAFSDHLAGCPSCRSELASHSTEAVAGALDRLLAEESETPHLTTEELIRWVDRALDPVESELVESHLEECAVCRSEGDELARFAATRFATPGLGTERAPARRRAWEWAATAATLAAASVVGWLALHPGSPPRASLPPVAARAPQAPQTVPPVAVETLHDGTLAVDAAGALRGIDDRWRPEVEAALRSPDLALPAAALALARNPERQRAEPGLPPSVRLTEPLSRLLVADRPTFRWHGPPDWVYQVEVFDLHFARVAASGPLRATSWTPGSPLPRGKLLGWNVSAVHDGEETDYPQPPQPPAVFQLATAEVTATVTAARATGSHLIAGQALWRAGLVEDAATELAALARENPRSSVARELAASSARGAARMRTLAGKD